jgi:transcriptional regulator with XRE-family HTH domain
LPRQESPLPRDAPAALRAFAQDLRDLRKRSGLTLKDLARRTNFSLTKLSEAQSGRHLPSENAVRRFVLGCNEALAVKLSADDAERFVRRLEALRQDPDVTGYVRRQDGRAGAEDGGRASQRGRRPRWRAAAAITAAVTTALAAILSGVAAFRDLLPTPDRGCPSSVEGAPFEALAKLDAGAAVREGASQDFRRLRRVPSGCMIPFKGYCIGEAIQDPAARLPDVRWLLTADGPGVVSSAVTRGDVPADLSPSECLGQRPVPSGVSLSIASASASAGPAPARLVRLSAEAPGAALVGFAAKYSDTPDQASVRWRQIGIVDEGAPFRLAWDAAAARADPTTSVPLVAVVCLAGEAPTDILSAGTYRPDASRSRATLSRLPLQGAERDDARQAACRYPSR